MRQKYMKTKILDLFTSWDNDTLILQTGNGNFNTWHNDTLNLDIRQRRHIMSQKYMKTRILDIFKSWHNDTLVLEKRHRRHVMRQKYIKATILHFSIDDTMTHILEKWQRYIGKFDLINDTMWQWFWKKYTPDFCTCFVILACMGSPIYSIALFFLKEQSWNIFNSFEKWHLFDWNRRGRKPCNGIITGKQWDWCLQEYCCISTLISIKYCHMLHHWHI